MFESMPELLEKIRLGEDSLLELKEVRFGGSKMIAPHADSLAQELAAFANSRGGVCVFGIEDSTREPQVLTPAQLDQVETVVRNACFDLVKPPLTSLSIQKITIPRGDGLLGAAVRVDVERSLFVHEAPGGYFHRVGSSKRSMAPDYLARLFQQRSQTRIIRFDEQIVPGAKLSDLAEPLWERFRTTRTKDKTDDLLLKLAMAGTGEDGIICPTVCGVLMASEDPCEWLPNAYIQAVAYSGTTVVPSSGASEYQLDAKDIKGPLDQQVVEACRFVVRNMTVIASKGVGRKDSPDYDITAIFEALVNAVAHRDYAIYGSKIRLRMFADRLEIYSPGAIPNTMTLESMRHRQSARNEELTSLLAKCLVPEGIDWLQTDRATLMDRRGEGVSIILERSEQLSGKKPVYALIDEDELLLTIYSAQSTAP
jgi:ATP-dependent DNA helicase RecG